MNEPVSIELTPLMIEIINEFVRDFPGHRIFAVRINGQDGLLKEFPDRH